MTDTLPPGALIFDGSTGSLDPVPSYSTPEPPDSSSLDALESLREQLRDRDTERAQDRLVPVEVPGSTWRLLCATDFNYEAYATWQRDAIKSGQRAAARTDGQRNRRRTRPEEVALLLDQVVLAIHVLLNTCEEVQFRNRAGDWVTVYDDRQEPVDLTTPAFLQKFDQVDPRVFIRKLFGGEPELIRASETVARAAGWLDDGDDASDPTV
jgi:hypothetical protein